MSRTPQPPARRRMTRDEYREHWMAVREEISELLNMAIDLQVLLPQLYEGVLGEEAPRYQPRLRGFDVEDEAEMLEAAS